MIDSAINLLGSLTWLGFLEMFWFLVIFEIPRYTMATLVAGYRAVAETQPTPMDPDVPVSVLLAGHNEADGLETSVRALREQTHRNIEIVVADDGSLDGTARIARDLLRRGLIDTFVGAEIRGGKASALNLGFQHCTHEYMVVMDVDTSLDRDAISRVVAPLRDDANCAAVSGNLGVRNPLQSPWTAFQSLEYIFTISLGRQFATLFDILLIVSGAFGAFRRSAIQGVGGWDVGPGDDSNLTQKLRRAGWMVTFEAEAWALTDVPSTRRVVYKQRMRWSRSLIRNRMRKFRSALNPMHGNFQPREVLAIANGLFFHGVLAFMFFIYVGYIMVSYPDLGPILLIAVHAVYIGLNMLEFMVAAVAVDRPGKWKLLPYLFGYSFYVAYFHRAIRVMAYMSELALRRSYQDPFYPTKVRRNVEKF